MTIDQLHYLILISRLGSINKASEQVHISQQALSTSMKQLENEIGHDLLLRQTHGISLTENGHILEKFAEEMLLKLDTALHQMHTTHTQIPETTEKLQVFFSPIIGNTYVANISKIFTHQHLSTQLLVMEKETTEIFEMITKDHIPALGFIASFTPPDMPIDYKSFPIYSDKLYLAISNTHPLAKQKSVSLHTILKYPLALYQSSHLIANNVCTLLESIGQPNYLTITNKYDIYQNAILYSNALGFTTKASIKNHTALPDIISKITTLPIRNCPPIQYLAIVTEKYLSNHQQSIHDIIEIFRSLF